MRTLQGLYLLIHTPAHVGRPLFVGTVQHNEWSNALFEAYKTDAERNRKAGGSYSYMSKKDIERWGFFPPCGDRFQVVDIEVPVGEAKPEPQARLGSNNINDME